jgi:protein disulfide-isomerase
MVKNINDFVTLSDLRIKAGLEKDEIDGTELEKLMRRDVGVQGVPFFVFDNKYAVSGAQHIEN